MRGRCRAALRTREERPTLTWPALGPLNYGAAAPPLAHGGTVAPPPPLAPPRPTNPPTLLSPPGLPLAVPGEVDEAFASRFAAECEAATGVRVRAWPARFAEDGPHVLL